MPIDITKINTSQIFELPREKTVFFFPVGPIEDHGPHLPVGLDLEEATRNCYLISEKLEMEMPGWVGVIMPVTSLGVEGNTTKFSITVRPHVLRDWLVDACQGLIRMGFFHFVCFTGLVGPRQLTAIEDAGNIIHKLSKWRRLRNWIPGLSPVICPSLVSAQSISIPFREVMRSPFWPDPQEHGGSRDTAMALYLAKELVDPVYSSLPCVEKERSAWSRFYRRIRKKMDGYWGDPSRANPHQARIEMNQKIEDLFPKLRAVWEGTNPNAIARSWYSILPPNKSFLKSWILLGCIAFLLWLWVRMTLDAYHVVGF